MKYSITLGIALFVIWLLWSGHFHEPFLIFLGIASCLVSVLLARRMGITDPEGVPAHLGLRPFTVYAPWLAKEIVKANIDVTRRILHPKLPIHPGTVCVKASQRSELGRVILANSITLTPGTVSIDVQGDRIWVHVLTYQGAEEDLSGDMDRRVSELVN